MPITNLSKVVMQRTNYSSWAYEGTIINIVVH
jgi:hypothetical protein